ncbi:hypothetical protein GUJ93_ZPchr0011g27939 [Zizania palustris]|uniref:Protein LAZY 1 n=1 Tax=Zizania palustris TaxID=103762 RepID=A0A8J5WEK2_ZIZPA|nr:hypothetical protein GUJ93_ZPchr0011g27939 [Zizania palustris]
MKLLGWMHRKLRSNNDVFKEFNSGGGGANNCITGFASPDPDTFIASATEYFAAGEAFGNTHASPPVTAGDLFTFGGSGLLTIGTLGIAAVAIPGSDDDDYEVDFDLDVDVSDGTVEDYEEDDGSVTPAFTFPPAQPAEASITVEKAVAMVEAIAEKDDDTTTEDDLMVVSTELEKVLGGGSGDVASARVSFAMGVDCPLQGFLFGSPVSDVESRPDQPHRDSGSRRTSLGELFMRTRFAEEKVALVAVAEGEDDVGDGAAPGGERDDGRAGKGGGDKTIKKRKVKDGKGATGGVMPATVTKSKFQKILQIFHRKVYPENTLLARNLTKKNRKRGAAGDPDEPAAAAESPEIRCRKDQRMPGFGCCTNRAFIASPCSAGGELNGSKSGHWIKTDADCE